MCFEGRVDLVAIECDDDGGMGGGIVERGTIHAQIALVDRLAERNSSEGNDFRIDGRIHEHGGARIKGQQRLKGWRNGIVVRLARLGILGALHIDDGTSTQEREHVEAGKSKEEYQR